MAYASKYYDPDKAHEYYMAHRNLKGRQRKRGSTAGMSEEGKAIAKYVKEQIDAEKKACLERISAEMKDKLASIRAELKERLKGLSKEEKEIVKAQYKEKIEAYRAAYKEYKKTSREYYKEKYYDEVESMQASGDFKAPAKRRKRKS